MDNPHDIHSWSREYRDEALREAKAQAPTIAASDISRPPGADDAARKQKGEAPK